MKGPSLVACATAAAAAFGLTGSKARARSADAEGSYVSVRGLGQELDDGAAPHEPSGVERATTEERSSPRASAAATSVSATAAAAETEAETPQRAYELWRDRVWRFANRLGVPHEALEDATQDVFAAVCRRWGDFAGLSTRRTWVLGFVPRVASYHRRRHRAQPQVQASCPDDEVLTLDRSSEAGAHDPFESAARREAQRIVQTFLGGLSDRDRQLFVLVDVEGETVVEAAIILELKAGHAYKCLDRVRRNFEAALARHHAGDGWRLR